MPLWRFEAIGTRWEVETTAPVPHPLRIAVEERIEAFDAAWSRFRPDSLVSRLAREGGTAPRPPDAAAMLALYATLSEATEGAVNPLAGESLVRLGYDADYSLRAGEPLPAPDDWRRILCCDEETLVLSEPALIDVGALGKGRLVDLVIAELAALPGEVVVDAGGDIAMRGGELRVGLEHPYDPHRAIGAVTLREGALCASATNRRAWGEGLHHVLDARTGAPVRRIAATWALAPTAMEADALATALFFDGGPRLAAERGVPWVRMTTVGGVEWSPGFPGELYVGGGTAPVAGGTF